MVLGCATFASFKQFGLCARGSETPPCRGVLTLVRVRACVRVRAHPTGF